MISSEKKERSRSGTSGLVFVGCLILGLAFGFIIGNVAGEVPNPGASAQNHYTASLPSEKHLIGE